MSRKNIVLIALGVITLSAPIFAVTDPVMMRLYGDYYDGTDSKSPSAGVAGTLDSSFGTSGQVDFTASPHDDYTAGNDAYISALRIQSDGWVYAAVDKGDGTNVIVEKMDADGNKVSSGFGTAGKLTLSKASAKYITFDVDGRILVCGGTGSAGGWIARLSSAGALDTNFGSSGYVTLGTNAIINHVAEQTSGRIIAAADDGVLYAFRSTGAADNTFNPNATSSNAYTVLADANLQNIIITSEDYILVAYLDTTVKVAKVKSDASGLVTAYGDSGIFDTTITPASENNIYMAKDNDGKLYVAAATSARTVKVARMADDSTASLDTTYDTDGIATTVAFGSTSFGLRALMHDALDNTVLVGLADSTDIKVVRLADNGSADATFGSSGIYTNAGAGTATDGGLDGVYAAAVHPDGSIFVGGDDQYSANSHPAMIRVFGDVYDAQYILPYSTGAAGALDTTFGTSGVLDLTSTFSLTNYAARKVHMNDDGSSIIAFENTTANAIKIVKLQPDMTLDTSFGDSSSGILTLTTVATSGDPVTPETISDLFVTRTGDIYASGVTTATTGWIAKVTSSGVVDTDFVMPVALGTIFTNMAKIQQQKDTKIVVSGTVSGGEVGLSSLNAANGTLDTTFAAGAGYLSIGSSTGFMDVTVDQFDRIYALRRNTLGDCNLYRYLSYAVSAPTIVETLLDGTSTGATGRLVVDTTNNKLVIAAVDGSSRFVVRCIGYSASSATLDTATDAQQTIGSSISGIADLLLDEQQNVYLAGYNSSNQIVVARLTNTAGDLAADASYGTSGVGVVTAGSMTRASAAAIHPDRRVVVVGSNTAGTNAYMTRLYGDAYNLELREELVMATHGTLDYILDSTNVDGYLQEDLSATSAIKRALYLPNTYNLAVACDNGTNSIVKTITLDGVIATGAASMPIGVTSLFASTYYSAGVPQMLLLAGNNGGTPWLKRTSQTGATDATSGRYYNTATYGGYVAGLLYYDGTDVRKTVDDTSVATVSATLSSPSYTVGSGDYAGTYTRSGLLTLVSSDITTANVAVEQKGGRIVVAGHFDDGDTIQTGVVVGYKYNGTGTDPRFGQVSLVGTSNAYRTGVDAAVQAMVVDASDYIYIAYIESGAVKVQKIKPDGSGLETAFATDGILATGITADATGTVQMALNADSSELIIACVVSGVIRVCSYETADGVQVVASTSLGAFTNITTPVLTDIQVASNNKVALVGYDSDNSHSFVARLTSGLALDSAFDSEGYFVVAAAAGTPYALHAVAIQADGKIIAAGRSNTTNNIIVTRLFSDPFESGVTDGIGQQVAGGQDTTADIGNALDISDSNTYTSARLIYSYTDGTGKTVLVLQDATHTYVKRLHKDNITEDTSFSADGLVTISNKLQAQKMIVDESGNIYITGGTSSSWLFACDSTGTSLFSVASGAITSSNAVARQTLQRTVIAGSDGSGGAIYAYNNAGTVDNTFGAGDGLYQTGVATPISDMFVDSNDRIIFAYRSGTSVVVKRLLPNGMNLDSTNFGTSGALTITSATTDSSGYDTQIKMHKFTDGTFALVYKTDATTVTMKKISTAGAVTATATQTVDNSSTVTAVQADSGTRLVVVGYETDAAYPWIIRLNSSFALDTTFSSDGYVLLNAGNLNVARAVTIMPDRRYILVGNNTAGTAAYMARVYGDSYTTMPSQNPSLTTVGSVDSTLSLDADVNYVSLTDLTAIASATPVGIVSYDNSLLYILLAGSTDSYIAAVNVDGIVDTTFNSGDTPGYVTISDKDSATSLMLTSNNTLLAAGKLSASSTAWVREYTTAGAQDTDAFTTANDTTNSTAFTTVSRVANIVQQSTIRTILGGKDGTGVVLIGINNAGALDSSFATSGKYADNALTNGLSHFVVDQKDRIVAAYLDTTIKVMRLNKHGRSLDTTFSTDGLVDTSVTASATAAQVVTDSSHKIFVAMANAGDDIIVKRYSEDGATVATGTLLQTTSGFVAPVVTQVLVTAAGKVCVLGYDENDSSDLMFVVCFDSSLALDTTFGESAVGQADGAGYITFTKTSSSATTRRIGAGVILANGRLMLVGYEA